MAYTVANGSIMEVTVRYEVAEQTCLNILHFELLANDNTSPGISLIESFIPLFDELTTGVTTRLANFCAQTTIIREIVCQWIYPQRYARRVYQPRIALGEIDSLGAPPNIACVATKRSDKPGSIGHGSIHVSGFTRDDISTDRLAQELVDNVQLYVNKLCATYEISTPEVTLDPVIYHAALPTQCPSVTSTSVSNEPRTMRRRGLRLGI